MCDNGELEDKPPAPPVRMSSSSKDGVPKPLPSVPEEKKTRKGIYSIFSAEKGQRDQVAQHALG